MVISLLFRNLFDYECFVAWHFGIYFFHFFSQNCIAYWSYRSITKMDVFIALSHLNQKSSSQQYNILCAEIQHNIWILSDVDESLESTSIKQRENTGTLRHTQSKRKKCWIKTPIYYYTMAIFREWISALFANILLLILFVSSLCVCVRIVSWILTHNRLRSQYKCSDGSEKTMRDIKPIMVSSSNQSEIQKMISSFDIHIYVYTLRNHLNQSLEKLSCLWHEISIWHTIVSWEFDFFSCEIVDLLDLSLSSIAEEKPKIDK